MQREKQPQPACDRDTEPEVQRATIAARPFHGRGVDPDALELGRAEVLDGLPHDDDSRASAEIERQPPELKPTPEEQVSAEVELKDVLECY